MVKTPPIPAVCRSRSSTISGAGCLERSFRSSTRDLSAPFYGANRPGSKCLAGRPGRLLALVDAGRVERGAYDCIQAFSETDLTEDLDRIDVPTLVIHGDDDQIVPIADLGAPVLEAHRGRDAEGLSGRAPWPDGHAQGTTQQGPDHVHPKLKSWTDETGQRASRAGPARAREARAQWTT